MEDGRKGQKGAKRGQARMALPLVSQEFMAAVARQPSRGRQWSRSRPAAGRSGIVVGRSSSSSAHTLRQPRGEVLVRGAAVG